MKGIGPARLKLLRRLIDEGGISELPTPNLMHRLVREGLAVWFQDRKRYLITKKGLQLLNGEIES